MNVLLLVTCRGKSRLPSLMACLSSIYTGLYREAQANLLACHYTVAVAFNQEASYFEDVNDGYGIQTWETLFKQASVSFEVYNYTKELSVPQMWVDVLRKHEGQDVFVSVDDDMIWHNLHMLDYLLPKVFKRSRPSSNYFASYGVWNIENTRNYDDWLPGVRDLEFWKAISKFGERTIWNQRPLSIRGNGRIHKYKKDTKLACAGSIVSIPWLLQQKELMSKFETWKKGERGYDSYLCNAWTGGKYHLIGPYVDHVGVYTPIIDGQVWTGYENPSLEIKNIK